MRICYATLILLIQASISIGQEIPQEKKKLQAYFTTETIDVDGRLHEKAWQSAVASGNWYTFSPTYGQPCPFNSEVAVLYDNDALYVGAWLNDPSADSIMHEISVRDYGMTKSEVFLVWLNPYNDGQNLLQFEASIANVQKDGKITNNSTDLNWNAIYQTATRIDDKGWYVEMRIPFKSIYFSDKPIQEWGINFMRWVPRKGFNYIWNPVDRTKNDLGSQCGILTGLKDLKQPLRLNLFPYVSGNYQKAPQGNSYGYSAGLDLQYGINESFTLDMTLVPDFGQRKSDALVLNLSPFEVQYQENRPFFLSGFELFKKSGLFYSRRIGKKPGLFDSVNDTAKKYGGNVLDNPMDSRLINAFKITGRTASGVGLGFFNALTTNTYAVVEDSLGRKNTILTEGGKNYNMFVYDKIISKYSYLNIANTNVYEFGNGKMTNVTGSAFKFSDSKNTYMIYGTAATSNKFKPKEKINSGFAFNVNMGKGSGNLVLLYNTGAYSDKYDPNAMGYLSRNNLYWNKILQRYTNFNPKAYFVNWISELSVINRNLYNTLSYYNTEFSYTFTGTFNNYSSIQFDASGLLFDMKDRFEPRTEGRFSIFPAYRGASVTLGSDTRKNIYNYISYGHWRGEGKYHYIGYNGIMKLSDKMNLRPGLSYEVGKNERGFAQKINADTIIYGYRDIRTLTFVLNGSYVFNNKQSLNLNLRQYWSKVDYYDYKFLNTDGTLSNAPFYKGNKDINFNTITIDLFYTWNFSPGSFLTLAWKNGIYLDDVIENNQFYSYFRNLNYVIGRPQTNMISFKLTYYLDYVYLTKWLKPRDRS